MSLLMTVFLLFQVSTSSLDFIFNRPTHTVVSSPTVEEVFANLTDVNKAKPKPIVMFADESSSEMANSAIKSGVNAYIIDGLEENRVQPIIDVAMARFREFQALKDELDATRSQLSERKVVEKAKGLLMKHKKVDEDAAYQSLRKMAMDKNKRIVDVAESVINAFELLD